MSERGREREKVECVIECDELINHGMVTDVLFSKSLNLQVRKRSNDQEEIKKR